MDFVDWIESELKKRKWKRADFAREGKISSVQVSRVLNREQGIGDVFIDAVALAFNVGIDEVYLRYRNMPMANEHSLLTRRVVSKVEKVKDNNALEAINKVLDIYIPDDDGHDNKKVRNK